MNFIDTLRSVELVLATEEVPLVVGESGIGSAVSEVRISENSTWYNGGYINSSNDYILRGGKNRGLFTTSDIGMFDVSTRSVLISK